MRDVETERSHDPATGALILMTPDSDNIGTFILYREGVDRDSLRFTAKEAENLAEELQRLVKGKTEHMRVLIPNIDKPKKITRPSR